VSAIPPLQAATIFWQLLEKAYDGVLGGQTGRILVLGIWNHPRVDGIPPPEVANVVAEAELD
jgi:hypothetical protein